MRRSAVFLLIIFAAMLAFFVQFIAGSIAFTYVQLQVARRDGVFSSPEQAMLSRIARAYPEPRQVEVTYAGPNAFDGSSPHIWYVIARVRAEKRFDGLPVGHGLRDYDEPGSFFLRMKDGWVHVPEGAFPEYVGFWMRILGWAGSDSATQDTDTLFCPLLKPPSNSMEPTRPAECAPDVRY